MDNDGKVLEFKKKIKTEADYIASLDEKLEERIQGFLRFENDLTDEEVTYLLEQRPFGSEYVIKGCNFEKLQSFNNLIRYFEELGRCEGINITETNIFKPNIASLSGSVGVKITNPFRLNNENGGLEIFSKIVNSVDFFTCMDNNDNQTAISACIRDIYEGDPIRDIYNLEWFKDKMP